MKRRDIRQILLAMGLIIYSFFFFKVRHGNEKWLNDAICNFARQEVKGKVQKRGGHGRYHWIIVNNSKYYFQVAKIITNPYKDNIIFINEGDSIAKRANSKEVEVYRGNKKSVFILRCED